MKLISKTLKWASVALPLLGSLHVGQAFSSIDCGKETHKERQIHLANGGTILRPSFATDHTLFSGNGQSDVLWQTSFAGLTIPPLEGCYLLDENPIKVTTSQAPGTPLANLPLENFGNILAFPINTHQGNNFYIVMTLPRVRYKIEGQSDWRYVEQGFVPASALQGQRGKRIDFQIDPSRAFRVDLHKSNAQQTTPLRTTGEFDAAKLSVDYFVQHIKLATFSITPPKIQYVITSCQATLPNNDVDFQTVNASELEQGGGPIQNFNIRLTCHAPGQGYNELPLIAWMKLKGDKGFDLSADGVLKTSEPGLVIHLNSLGNDKGQPEALASELTSPQGAKVAELMLAQDNQDVTLNFEAQLKLAAVDGKPPSKAPKGVFRSAVGYEIEYK